MPIPGERNLRPLQPAIEVEREKTPPPGAIKRRRLLPVAAGGLILARQVFRGIHIGAEGDQTNLNRQVIIDPAQNTPFVDTYDPVANVRKYIGDEMTLSGDETIEFTMQVATGTQQVWNQVVLEPQLADGIYDFSSSQQPFIQWNSEGHAQVSIFHPDIPDKTKQHEYLKGDLAGGQQKDTINFKIQIAGDGSRMLFSSDATDKVIDYTFQKPFAGDTKKFKMAALAGPDSTITIPSLSVTSGTPLQN